MLGNTHPTISNNMVSLRIIGLITIL